MRNKDSEEKAIEEITAFIASLVITIAIVGVTLKVLAYIGE